MLNNLLSQKEKHNFDKNNVMNPFLINTYISPKYFCDREEETEQLLKNIKNNSNTAFFAQRRIGKTALIKHVLYQLPKEKTAGVYIDIFATQNLKEFTNQLANSIYTLFPVKHKISKLFLQTLKLLRPVISTDEITGAPQLSLDISKTEQYEKSLVQILKFVDQLAIKIVIAIDEFQQILSYPEKNIEALLRTSIQDLNNVSFIFCGSNQKLMNDIFNNSKKPFYASQKSINLKKIEQNKLIPFIKNHFTEGKFSISEEALIRICDITDYHTYYTQRLCHELYANNVKKIDEMMVIKTMRGIATNHEATFFQYRNLITSTQWKLLNAIALEGKLFQPYAQDFIYKHQLGTPANVKRTLDALLEKEMVYHQSNCEEPYFEVYDKFLKFWLRSRPMY